MAPSVSIREYIRWPPNAPSEPTSTLVLTSNSRHYVDIRILKQPSGSHSYDVPFAGIQPLSQIDWAFAGTSSTKIEPDGPDDTRLHATWRHFVDSRTADAETVVDEGDIVPLPGGLRSLEYGRMRNPDTDRVEDYEESWLEIEPVPDSHDSTTPVATLVLLLHDDTKDQRGVVVRVGAYCQGVMRIGEGVSAERWLWDDPGGWTRRVRVGDMWMPCGPAMEGARLRLGGEVRQGEQLWRVVELTEPEQD